MTLRLHKMALLHGAVLASVLSLAQSNSSLPPLAQDPDEIIKFLSKIVAWHREITVQQPVGQPSDLAAVQENRIVADQVVQLGFEYARSQAELKAKSPAAPQPQAEADTQYQALVREAQRADKEVQDTDAELQSVRGKLATGPPQQKTLLESQIADRQTKLGLLHARRDALASMVEFVNSSNSGAGSRRARIAA